MLNTNKKEKPRFISTLIIAAVAGAIFVLIRLFFPYMVLRLSAISFYGWIAAGVTFFVAFSAINYFIPQGFDVLQRLSWYFSGVLAGFVWWIVIKPPSIQMWMTIVAGLIIAVFLWFVEIDITRRKSSASKHG
jgi:hypothetical protein